MSEPSQTEAHQATEPVVLISEGPETPLPIRDHEESLAQEQAWKKEWSARSSHEKAFDD